MDSDKKTDGTLDFNGRPVKRIDTNLRLHGIKVNASKEEKPEDEGDINPVIEQALEALAEKKAEEKLEAYKAEQEKKEKELKAKAEAESKAKEEKEVKSDKDEEDEEAEKEKEGVSSNTALLEQLATIQKELASLKEAKKNKETNKPDSDFSFDINDVRASSAGGMTGEGEGSEFSEEGTKLHNKLDKEAFQLVAKGINVGTQGSYVLATELMTGRSAESGQILSPSQVREREEISFKIAKRLESLHDARVKEHNEFIRRLGSMTASGKYDQAEVDRICDRQFAKRHGGDVWEGFGLEELRDKNSSVGENKSSLK